MSFTILCEKHSVAKDFASFFGAGNRIPEPSNPKIAHWEFTFGGEKCYLCHARGHLIALNEPKDYGSPYVENKKWNFSAFPILPETYRKKYIDEESKACLDVFARCVAKSDYIVSATDNDREGDLIFAYIYDVLPSELKKPYKRLIYSEINKEEILRAMKQLVDGKYRKRISDSGRVRSELDWLIGMNVTVLSTSRLQYFDSVGKRNTIVAGRVITPLLHLICEREKKVTSFEKSFYYRIVAKLDNGVLATCVDDFDTKDKAENFKQSCVGKPLKVKEFENKEVSEGAKLLYNTASLETECNKLYNLTPLETDEVLESLYLKGLITYPRTSAEFLSVVEQEKAQSVIIALFNSPLFSRYKLPVEEWQKFSERHFKDFSKLESPPSHSAIIPTTKMITGDGSLSEEEYKVYMMICKRLLSVVMPKAIYRVRTVVLTEGQRNFKASSKTLQKEGWRVLYSDEKAPEEDVTPSDEEQTTELPFFNVGATHGAEYSVKECETAPPKRYTLGTLISAMELCGQKVEDEELASFMKLKGKSLGTGATRGASIDRLMELGYIGLKGKSVIPTEKGLWVDNKMPLEELKDVDFTAELEYRLNGIEEGRIDVDNYREAIKAMIVEWSQLLKSSAEAEYHEENTLKANCPKCSGAMAESKFAYVCTNKDCGLKIPSSIGGKTITATMLRKLCKEGRTDWISGLKNKEGKEFTGFLKYNKELGKVELCFNDERLKCPICQAEVNRNAKGVFCSSSSCNFRIFSNYFDMELTAKQITDLVVRGKTDLIHGLKYADSTEYSGYLVYNKEKRRVESEAEKLKCPCCADGIIKAGKNAYFCTSCDFENNNYCFYVKKTFKGMEITDSIMRQIVTNGATKNKYKFRKEDNSEFEAKLGIDKVRKRLCFVFGSHKK